MKYLIHTAIAFIFLSCIIACNNAGKDSVQKADSINEAKLDTGLNNQQIVIDEASSAFLVRAADESLTELEITSLAQQQTNNGEINDFAGMLRNEHLLLSDKIKKLAVQKNITLPIVISDDRKKEITILKTKTDKNFDSEFLNNVIKNYQASIAMFEKAMLDTKDEDIRSFADKSLAQLKSHMEAAKHLIKK